MEQHTDRCKKCGAERPCSQAHITGVKSEPQWIGQGRITILEQGLACELAGTIVEVATCNTCTDPFEGF